MTQCQAVPTLAPEHSSCALCSARLVNPLHAVWVFHCFLHYLASESELTAPTLLGHLPTSSVVLGATPGHGTWVPAALYPTAEAKHPHSSTQSPGLLQGQGPQLPPVPTQTGARLGVSLPSSGGSGSSLIPRISSWVALPPLPCLPEAVPRGCREVLLAPQPLIPCTPVQPPRWGRRCGSGGAGTPGTPRRWPLHPPHRRA